MGWMNECRVLHRSLDSLRSLGMTEMCHSDRRSAATEQRNPWNKQTDLASRNSHLGGWGVYNTLWVIQSDVSSTELLVTSTVQIPLTDLKN